MTDLPAASRDAIVEAVGRLTERQVTVQDIGIRRPTLDDAFLSLTGHSVAESEEMARAAADAATRLDLAGSGFRDFTRIAAGSPEMWRDIFLSNRDAMLAELAEGLA